MAMWDVDLTTRMGAETATRMGAIAAFTFTGMTVIGGAFTIAFQPNPGSAHMIGQMIGVAIEAAPGVIAGFRLRAGKGLIWGGVTLALAALEQLVKIVAFSLSGFFLGLVVLVYLVNGVRGAYTLRQNRFAEDEAEVFA